MTCSDESSDLHFEYGRYKPAFFSITVNTSHRFDNIANLPKEVQPTFFHEYFHFIQNITTPSGINSSWNSLDQIRRLIGNAQRQTQPIKLPLTDEDFKQEIKKQNDALFALNSDSRLYKDNPDSYQIVNLTLELRPEFDNFSPESRLRFLKLHLKNDEGNEAKFWFGSFAVHESMTYLIQSKFFGEANAPVYPYLSAKKLLQYANSPLANNDEMIFALCDVALLSTTPGKSFWDVLLYVTHSRVEITDPEQIYELAMNYYSEHGYNIEQSFSKDKDSLLNVISQLYGHEIFQYDLKWLNVIIEEGFQLRSTHPLFMLDLYRGNEAFSGMFYFIFLKLGTPDIINLSGERWISVPGSIKEIETKVSSVFLSVYNEWHELLLKDKKGCGLQQVCRMSEPKMPVDDNCKDSPWLKRNDEPVCPYAAIMHVF